MEISVREELIILTSIFCFCMFAIPIIILNAKPINHYPSEFSNKHLADQYSELDFSGQLLVDSVEVLANLNRHKTENESLVEFVDLLGLSEIEFEQKYGNLRKNFTARETRRIISNTWKKFGFSTTNVPKGSLKLPLIVDWRDRNVVSKVKRQISCGSCFALSVTESIESMLAIRTGTLKELSVQQMLDCNEYGMKCKGGDNCLLLEWLQSSQTDVQLDSDYPSLDDNDQQSCKSEDLVPSGIKVIDYSCDAFNSREELMLLYLARRGPLIASIDALPLKSYKSGSVQQSCDGKTEKLNHAVQIVGYDLTGKIPFYIAKNSWGREFGNEGFMKIAVGRNVCGIAESVAAVIV